MYEIILLPIKLFNVYASNFYQIPWQHGGIYPFFNN